MLSECAPMHIVKLSRALLALHTRLFSCFLLFDVSVKILPHSRHLSGFDIFRPRRHFAVFRFILLYWKRFHSELSRLLPVLIFPPPPTEFFTRDVIKIINLRRCDVIKSIIFFHRLNLTYLYLIPCYLYDDQRATKGLGSIIQIYYHF